MSGHEQALVTDVNRALQASYEPVLSFDAPYLIEKLVKDRVVDSAAEGEALFAEVKKYLILSQVDSAVSWNMYSRRVDEVWHQFVLFTSQYVEFCNHYFGHYLHHNPSNAPEGPGRTTLTSSTLKDFRARYAAFFGEPLPDIWEDGRSVSLSRRVINDHAGTSQVSVDNGTVYLSNSAESVDIMVNEVAREALEFIARTDTFFVRELPDVLTDHEKVGLVATLVEHGVLRVAA